VILAYIGLEPMMSDFAERKDSFMSAGYTSQRRMLNTRRNHGAFIPRQSRRSEAPIAIGQSNIETKYDNEKSNADSDTIRFEQLYHMAHSDTSSDSLSGLEQEAECCREQYARPLRESASNHTRAERVQKIKNSCNPVAEDPTSPKQRPVKGSSEEEEDEGRLYHGGNFIGRSVIHHRGFSFIPGDDFVNLALGSARTVQALDGYGNNGRRPRSYLSSSNEFTDPIPAKKQRRKRPVLGEGRVKNAVRESNLTTGYEFEPTRNDSQTSIITAVPDQNAGRSRLTGSNEATIAAVRAIAESGRMA
jgi:hypothetical protein